MNKFELFTLIYFWLSRYYKDETDDRIINQLSEMNPFIWADIGSADPAVYIEYCAFLGEKEISLENSLSIAKDYVKTIDYVDVTAAFKNIDPEEWIHGCEKYLSTEHKGADING